MFEEAKKNKELADYVKSNLPDPKLYVRRFNKFDIDFQKTYDIRQVRTLNLNFEEFDKEDNTHWFDIETNEYCIFDSELYERDLHKFVDNLKEKVSNGK